MYIEKDLNKIFTIPNIISFLRIIIIVPFVIFFLKGDYILAGVMLVISGLSDLVDGSIARKLNQVTELGKMLDPIADKLTLIAVLVCVTLILPQILPLVIMLLIKDILMIIGGTYLAIKNIPPIAARWYGKLATVIFYFSMITIVVLEIYVDVGKEYNFSTTILILLILTTISMLFAVVKYAMIFLKVVKENKINKN